MSSAQGDRQAAVRALTGTSLDYDGDWSALFDQAAIPQCVDGDYSGSMLYWPAEAVSGAWMTPPSVIPATTIRMELDARLKTGVACAATIRARAMGLIKVS